MDKEEIMTKDSFPGTRSIGLLLDPDKVDDKSLFRAINVVVKCAPDFILVGGSLTFQDSYHLINEIKRLCAIPVVIFPGSPLQVCRNADLILFLSLISGRNPELLIGNHVTVAPLLRNSRDKIFPVGYILVDGGSYTSVEYMSNTKAIPRNKPDIAVATALAGEMLGLKAIYLEAGSGAAEAVPKEMISLVRENISIPLIVGGGIKKSAQVEEIFDAGANMIVIGSAFERDPGFLMDACAIRDKLSK